MMPIYVWCDICKTMQLKGSICNTDNGHFHIDIDSDLLAKEADDDYNDTLQDPRIDNY